MKLIHGLNFKSIKGDLLGGVTAAVVALPLAIAFGETAYYDSVISDYFKHVLKGPVKRWDVPGINGLNFLLMNSLGGGGMASLYIDPQGKAYAQMLLEIPIPVPKNLAEKLNNQ